MKHNSLEARAAAVRTERVGVTGVVAGHLRVGERVVEDNGSSCKLICSQVGETWGDARGGEQWVEPQETEPRSRRRAMGRQIHRRGRLNFVVFLLRYKIKLPKGQLIIAAY